MGAKPSVFGSLVGVLISFYICSSHVLGHLSLPSYLQRYTLAFFCQSIFNKNSYQITKEE